MWILHILASIIFFLLFFRFFSHCISNFVRLVQLHFLYVQHPSLMWWFMGQFLQTEKEIGAWWGWLCHAWRSRVSPTTKIGKETSQSRKDCGWFKAVIERVNGLSKLWWLLSITHVYNTLPSLVDCIYFAGCSRKMEGRFGRKFHMFFGLCSDRITTRNSRGWRKQVT